MGLAFWLGLVLWPGRLPGCGYGPGADRLVLASGGELLAELAGSARRAGPWLSPGEIPEVVKAAALAAEDRRFYYHPGVDPLAVLRAAWVDLRAGRVVTGASTITMQLARLQRPGPRGWGRKLAEAWQALWLEWRLSKEEILCQYLNRAPFGGPLVGLGAASRELLGKDPSRLAPQEAALLLALPQDPARLLRPSQRGRLRARRDAILRAMHRAGALGAAALARALAAPVDIRRLPRAPVEAPHFLRALAARLPALAPARVRTYLDAGLQRRVQALVRSLCRGRREQGLRQAAVLVLDNRRGGVLAWVGSADFRDPVSGQVDGVLARRQPGSSLKPFIYALALERGYTLADRLEDEPLTLAVQGGAFRPVDYDGRHRGAVSLRVALASSLNLPALRLTAALTPAAVLERLRELGFRLPRKADFYGLGLALGDGEVSLLELTRAYSALARGGVLKPVRFWQGQEQGEERRVFSPAAARLVADVLSDDRARSLGFGRHGILELPFPAAVKTGTSQQHRDNWCVGFTRDYTVGVWVGNFEGRPMAGISGVTGAGPLWRQVMLLLHRDQPGKLGPWPPGMVRMMICSQSGRPAGPLCPSAREEIFAPGSLPRGTCPLHRPRLARGEEPETARNRPGLSLLVPAPGAVYALDPDVPPALQVLACQAQGEVARARWFMDGRPLAPGDDPLQARVRLVPGRHLVELRAWDSGGREHRVRASFLVLGPAGGEGKT